MVDLESISSSDGVRLRDLMRAAGSGSDRLDLAAQRAVEALHAELRGSAPLIRLYATFPFAELPTQIREFANGVARKGINTDCTDDTPVLTLLGSAGDLPQWNDPRSSVGHQAIPLLSAEFVHSIPMIANLLEQFGMDLGREPASSLGMLCRIEASFAGLFFVDDAATLEDANGRRVIPAQDFVARHGIRSVIGSGGIHIATKSLAVLIIFTKHRLSAAQAAPWTRLALQFVSAHSRRFTRGSRFDASS